MKCSFLVRVCSKITPCKRLVCLYLRAKRGQLPPHLTLAFFTALVLFVIILFYLYALGLSRYGRGRDSSSSPDVGQDSSLKVEEYTVDQAQSQQPLGGSDGEVVPLPPPVVYRHMVPLETCPKQEGFFSTILPKEKSNDDASSKCQKHLSKFLQMTPKCVTLRQLQKIVRNNIFDATKYNADVKRSQNLQIGEENLVESSQQNLNIPLTPKIDPNERMVPLELPRKRLCRACSKRNRAKRGSNPDCSDQEKGIVMRVIDYR